MARLIISSPDGKRGIFELTKPVITIGRGSANDLVLNDGSVSRFHAVVKQMEEGVVIADRGSTNGVRINDLRIEAETAIQNGDIAQVGSFEIRFESVDHVAFDVHKAEVPSSLDQFVQGMSGIVSLPPGVTPAGVDDLMREVKKLERDNY